MWVNFVVMHYFQDQSLEQQVVRSEVIELGFFFIISLFLFYLKSEDNERNRKVFLRTSEKCHGVGFFFSAANIWWKKWDFVLDSMNRILRSLEHWPSPALIKVNMRFDFDFTRNMLSILAALIYNTLWQRLEPENNSN